MDWLLRDIFGIMDINLRFIIRSRVRMICTRYVYIFFPLKVELEGSIISHNSPSPFEFSRKMDLTGKYDTASSNSTPQPFRPIHRRLPRCAKRNRSHHRRYLRSAFPLSFSLPSSVLPLVPTSLLHILKKPRLFLLRRSPRALPSRDPCSGRDQNSRNIRRCALIMEHRDRTSLFRARCGFHARGAG